MHGEASYVFIKMTDISSKQGTYFSILIFGGKLLNKYLENLEKYLWTNQGNSRMFFHL
jgi:hypothetical protein